MSVIKKFLKCLNPFRNEGSRSSVFDIKSLVADNSGIGWPLTAIGE